MKKVRIGTRDSRLAIIQTEMVASAIKLYNPEIEIEIIKMKTTGDKILDVTLDKIGGKGLFVKELDEALLSNSVDITVHSYKDMPMEINEKLPIVATGKREDPRDVLICRQGLTEPPKIIGSSSNRRRIQLRGLGFTQCNPIRGNLQTRLSKLDSGEFDAIVLAAAGIKRLGLENRIHKYFTVEEILPSACQGIIAVQSRIGEDTEYLKLFHNEESKLVSKAERAFVTALGGGCSSPIAAYCTVENSTLTLFGLYADEEERVYKGSIQGQNPEELGAELAKMLMKG